MDTTPNSMRRPAAGNGCRAAAALCALLVVLAGCARREPCTGSRFLLHARCTITIPATEKNGRQAIDKAFERIEAIERALTVREPGGPLYAFNTQGTPVRDPELARLIRFALAVSSGSAGAFDPTVYPLVTLWGFDGDRPALPAPGEIAHARAFVGREKLRLEGDAVYPRAKGVKIDLGALAAGYAADEALRVLKGMGIRAALIDTGGELYALGTNNGKPWRIGLKNPRGEGIIGVIEACDEAVSTSGDYEKFFLSGGRRYHHILDPATGYPAESLASATVIAPTAAAADAWSTALIIMGKERGFAALAAQPGMEAVVVGPDGAVAATPAACRRFKAAPAGGIDIQGNSI